MLEEVPEITYYNPEVGQGEWHEGLVASEDTAKKIARWVMWVITENSRASASLVEASRFVYHLEPGQRLAIVMGANVAEGQEIEGTIVTGSDLRDANRQRHYVRDMVSRRLSEDVDSTGVSVFWVGDKEPFYRTTDDAIGAATRFVMQQLLHP